MEQIKFRASAMSKLMTEARSKSEALSETTKTYLIEKFINEKYGRYKFMSNKYIEKGLAVEEDSITLYSRATKTFFKKNEEHLNNAYLTGTPDCFIGESIYKAECIIDFKSSWDIFTFFNAQKEKVNKDYYWQMQSYMALTGAKESRLVYCLVNTPETIINDEKRKLFWKMGAIDENELTDEAGAKMEKEMLFDDIPMKERIYEVVIERNSEDIVKMYDRIDECRKYMNETINLK